MNYDAIIVGAGPAGMAAATTIAEAGGKVLALDDQGAPGGQIYRAIESADKNTADVLGAEYMAGQTLAQSFRKQLNDQALDYIPDANVWQVTDGREVGYSAGGKAKLLRAPWIILATGATERPFPIPGWTLPGVMMAGAAQTLLKSSGLSADGAVFAGSGPLLYLVVHQYLKAGMRIAALLDTTASNNRLGALSHLPAALSRWDLLSKGRRWMAEIKRSGTTMINNVTALKVLGEDAATGMAYRTGSGGWREISSPHVFLHQGVAPNINLSMAAGIKHVWNENQLCWRPGTPGTPGTDDWGRTDIDGLVVAGDGAGIDGALAAEAAGRLVALGVLEALGKIDAPARDRRAVQPRKTLKSERKIRPFLDAWFRPADHFRVPVDNDTMICRCEELTLKDLRDVIDIGLAGPNQLKSFCRAGMGPCQGRFCGLTVQELIARETGRSASEVGYYRLRPPIKPLPLEELANLEADPPGNDG